MLYVTIGVFVFILSAGVIYFVFKDLLKESNIEDKKENVSISDVANFMLDETENPFDKEKIEV